MGVGFALYTDPAKAGYPLIVTYRYRKHGNVNNQYASKCSLPEKSLVEIQKPIKDRLQKLEQERKDKDQMERYTSVRAPNSQCEFARLRKIAKRSEFASLRFAQNGLDFASLSLRNF
jgi:hypothetical protein